MSNLIREAPLVQFFRFLSGRRLFRYPEELPGFEKLDQYAIHLNSPEEAQGTLAITATPNDELQHRSHDFSGATGGDAEAELRNMGMTRTRSRQYTTPFSSERAKVEDKLALERTKTIPIIPRRTADGLILVDWYTTDDPANPHNWSSLKRGFVTFLICIYTWVVYTGSSIYAPSESGVMEAFQVSPTLAVLPLSLYVLAYGVGPLLWAPLCEIPVVGRNPVYIFTFILFFILSFPTAVANNFGGLLALRFFQGFSGSPALANGLSWWVCSAWGGPALSPLMAGFAVPAKNWHWSLWEIVWMAAPVVLLLLALIPETSASNILLRCARRLRQLHGDTRFQSQSEIDQRQLTASGILVAALIKPIEITLKDPAIFFYEFNSGEIGLAFLSCQIGATIGLVSNCSYLYWYMIPDNIQNGLRQQEHRLVPAILGSFLIPAGLFIFGWTARESIHWIVPLIGVVVFVVGTFYILQSIFVYLPLSYPKHAASLFAGNDLKRSSMACGSVLFPRPLFLKLGIAEGVTPLAGLSIVGIIGKIALYYYGANLRARSKFAERGK